MMEALSCVYDEDALARTLLGTEVLTRSAQKARSANKATPLSVGAVNDIVIKTAGGGGDDGDDDDGDDDDEEEEGDVNSASANMLSRHSGGNSGVGGGAPADGNAASRTSNADADAVQPDAPPVRDGVVGTHEGKVWGIASLEDEQDGMGIGNLHKFDREIPIELVEIKPCKLLSLLGGDIEFLHTVLGLQSCSSTWPCLHCLIKLEDLRKATNFQSGPLRTTSHSYNSKAICRGRGHAS
mmetsp:Transcript_28455/g.66784  ORF Transcript_28455/g.66784 Transcript_28455/m.66784 type:complete len:240 (+) Transcript_28455:289-1008(+)